MNHKAIYALYPNVVKIDDGAGAFDANGNTVEIDTQAVNSWIDPEQYKINRADEYPSIVDQLDVLYHGGYDVWKSTISTIKQKYPKPTNE
jgi:hypothetical protein